MFDIGDGIAFAALVAGVLGFRYIKSREQQRRLEILHAERLAAMDKGIPLPELPLDPSAIVVPPDPRGLILVGIILIAVGVGAWFVFVNINSSLWAVPMPVILLGFGFLLFYVLTRNRPPQ